MIFLSFQMPDAGNERVMPALLRPLDRFGLRREDRELVVGMILDDIIVDTVPLGPAFGARLDINVRHDDRLSLIWPLGR